MVRILDRLKSMSAMLGGVFLVATTGVAVARGEGPTDPACRKSSVSSSEMTSMGRRILIDTFPAGVEIDPRRLRLFDDNRDGRLDDRDARFRDSLGFSKQGAGPVLTPRQAGISRVYLTAEGASLDPEGQRPVRVHARLCFGSAQLAGRASGTPSSR